LSPPRHPERSQRFPRHVIERSVAESKGESSENRQGWDSGFKDKTVLTGLGKLKVKIPQVGNGEAFYTSALEKGICSKKALKAAISEMYLQGVSTRKSAKITEALCGSEISFSQVSKLTKTLDLEFEKRRNGEIGNEINGKREKSFINQLLIVISSGARNLQA